MPPHCQDDWGVPKNRTHPTSAPLCRAQALKQALELIQIQMPVRMLVIVLILMCMGVFFPPTPHPAPLAHLCLFELLGCYCPRICRVQKGILTLSFLLPRAQSLVHMPAGSVEAIMSLARSSSTEISSSCCTRLVLMQSIPDIAADAPRLSNGGIQGVKVSTREHQCLSNCMNASGKKPRRNTPVFLAGSARLPGLGHSHSPPPHAAR